jgi:hypothetical protein
MIVVSARFASGSVGFRAELLIKGLVIASSVHSALSEPP